MEAGLLVQEHNVVLGLLWQQQQQCNPGSGRVPGECWLPQFGPCTPGPKLPAILEQPDEDLKFIPLHRTTQEIGLSDPNYKVQGYFFRNIERKTAPVRSTSPPPAYAAVDSRNFSAIEE